MANDKPIKVGDYVVGPDGYAYKIEAIDGDLLVIQGEATNRGNPLNGKTIVDQRKVKLQKVSAAFINALKGTP